MHNTDLKLERRDNVLHKAGILGISRSELIDSDTAIALRAARLFATAVGHSDNMADSPFAHHIIPLLTFDSENISNDVKVAIAAIAELPGRVDEDDLKSIAHIIDLHAQFTRSCPVDRTQRDWMNELTDIATSMTIAIDWIADGNREKGNTLLHDTCLRLSQVYPHLWS